MTNLEIKECRLPLCTNERAEDLPLCMSCMVNSVRQFLFANGDIPSLDYSEQPNEHQITMAGHWWRYVLANIDELIEQEAKSVIERKNNSNIRLVYSKKED